MLLYYNVKQANLCTLLNLNTNILGIILGILELGGGNLEIIL